MNLMHVDVNVMRELRETIIKQSAQNNIWNETYWTWQDECRLVEDVWDTSAKREA